MAPGRPHAAPPAPPPRPSFAWQRLTRTRRGAAGLAIGSAALLLWPFSGWSWIPWLVGLGVLVLLRLLRLDGLLRGWVWHLGGLVVVAGLMYSTGPWAWALAASIGVLVAGLLQLPWWRLAAVGVVMCAVSGVGFGFSTYRPQEAPARAGGGGERAELRLQGERTPSGWSARCWRTSRRTTCPRSAGCSTQPARPDVVRVTGATDCPGALAAVPQPREQSPGTSTSTPRPRQNGAVWLTDACRTPWATPALGGQRSAASRCAGRTPPGGTYFVSRFLPC